MFIDANSVDQDKSLDCEVCIIGSGAAGITLAREFVNAPFRVVLLESGGMEYEAETQSLSAGANIGHPYYALHDIRLRYFGGTTNHWGGHCLPIRPMNFERRSWIPHSGWPLSRKQLDPFYKRAHHTIGLGPYEYDPEILAGKTGKPLFPFNPGRVSTTISRYKPLRFGDQYLTILANAPNITTHLHANVVSINRMPETRRIGDVSVRTLEGNRYQVRAKLFILAAGGIENPRILLLSDRRDPGGLGNERDLVGRYFMEHIWYPSGYIIPADQSVNYDLYTRVHMFPNQIGMVAHLTLPESVVRREQIPDFRAEITERMSPVLDENQGNQAAFDRDIANLAGAKNDMNSVRTYRLMNYSEQIPNPDSRVTLSKRTDVLDCRTVQLNWQLSTLDKEGIRRAQQLIAREVGRTGFGRLRMELPEDEFLILPGASGGAHHMGTTRMGTDPGSSVVDANCKLHSIDNLYTAGSSVFPASGFSNPTLTIVALALRLADHIKRQLKRS